MSEDIDGIKNSLIEVPTNKEEAEDTEELERKELEELKGVLVDLKAAGLTVDDLKAFIDTKKQGIVREKQRIEYEKRLVEKEKSREKRWATLLDLIKPHVYADPFHALIKDAGDSVNEVLSQLIEEGKLDKFGKVVHDPTLECPYSYSAIVGLVREFKDFFSTDSYSGMKATGSPILRTTCGRIIRLRIYDERKQISIAGVDDPDIAHNGR